MPETLVCSFCKIQHVGTAGNEVAAICESCARDIVEFFAQKRERIINEQIEKQNATAAREQLAEDLHILQENNNA